MTIGYRIRNLRETLGLSQIDVANAIGVSKQTLYKYEHDIVSNIPSDKIEALAHKLNTTPAYLMGWEDEKGEYTLLGQLIKSYEKRELIESFSQYDPEIMEQAMFLYELYRQAPPEIQAAVETLLKATKSDS